MRDALSCRSCVAVPACKKQNLDSEVRKRALLLDNANFGVGTLEHDPEKRMPVSGKIMFRR
jgi:hypothetical protein